MDVMRGMSLAYPDHDPDVRLLFVRAFLHLGRFTELESDPDFASIDWPGVDGVWCCQPVTSHFVQFTRDALEFVHSRGVRFDAAAVCPKNISSENVDFFLDHYGGGGNLVVTTEDVLAHCMLDDTPLGTFVRLVRHDRVFFSNRTDLLREILANCIDRKTFTDVIRGKVSWLVTSGAAMWSDSDLDIIRSIAGMKQPQPAQRRMLEEWKKGKSDAVRRQALKCLRLIHTNEKHLKYIDVDQLMEVVDFARSLGCPMHPTLSLFLPSQWLCARGWTVVHEHQELMEALLRDMRSVAFRV